MMGLLPAALTELVLLALSVTAVTARAGAPPDGGTSTQKSRARAVGHTWLLFALLSGPVAVVSLIGGRTGPSIGDVLGTLLLALTFAVSIRQATLAYGFARTLRPHRGLWGGWAAAPGSPALDEARDAGDIESIGELLKDPDIAPALRRKATLALATTKSGGGRSSAWRPNTDPRATPILSALVTNDSRSRCSPCCHDGASRNPRRRGVEGPDLCAV